MKQDLRQGDYSSAILSSVDVPVIATDKDLLIEYCNAKAEQFFGIKLTDLKGSSVINAMIAIGCELPWKQLKADVLKKGAWQGKLFFKRNNKEVFCLDVSFTPAKDKAGDVIGYACICQEKTGNTHDDIARVKEHQLNDLKSRFITTASHEFRTPLSTILSSVYLLEKYITEDQQTARLKHAERIKESVTHMNELLEDFLSIGRLEEGKLIVSPSLFNLQELISEIIVEMQPLKKQGQEIFVSYDGKEQAQTDKKMIKNILANLLSNALKFSGANKLVWLYILHSNNNLSIKIKDQGIGISRDDLRHLFETFYRGKNAQNIQGTGLGLHIAKRYVKLLNGDIHVNSEIGRGTEVSFDIPLPFVAKLKSSPSR